MRQKGEWDEKVDRYRVLVVDDDAASRQLCSEILGQERFEIEEAENGEKALAAIKRNPPDLVLLDLVMPGLDGMSLCRIIKESPEPAFLPVIILTAHGNVNQRIEALRLGADDYLTKPVDGREMLARVEALLRIKKLQDGLQESLRLARGSKHARQGADVCDPSQLAARLSGEYSRARRMSEPLALMLINAGENADWADGLAGAVRECVREYDVVGLDENGNCAVVLPRTMFAGAATVAERIWKKLSARVGSQVKLSIGVSFYPGMEVDSDAGLVKQARRALEKARASDAGYICLLQHSAYYLKPDIGR